MPTPEKVETPIPEVKPPEVAVKVVDDFGYEKPPEEKKLDEKPVEKPTEVKIETQSTGYNKEPKAPEVAIPPVEEKKDTGLAFELKVDPVIPKEELSKVVEFAKAHSLTKEATQALLDTKKSEVENFQKAQVEAEKNYNTELAQTRAKWFKELKDDPKIGGDKLEHNVNKVERVMQEFMPETKKFLTERGSMLPPYVMRDFIKLADHLYSTEALVNGEPVVPAPEKKEDDPLAFYT